VIVWQVTDSGMCHLRSQNKLIQLDVGGTEVTDEGLDHLHGLQLACVKTQGNKGVTEFGAARLLHSCRGLITPGQVRE